MGGRQAPGLNKEKLQSRKSSAGKWPETRGVGGSSQDRKKKLGKVYRSLWARRKQKKKKDLTVESLITVVE